jgi:glycine cleavage system H protein
MRHFPEDLRYAQTHEWVKLEDNAIIRVGISDFAQAELGDLVYIELPKIGQYVSAGDACATVESVKAASELYAPVSGEIVAINEAVEDEPELVNDEPYETWLFCLKVDDVDELDSLMDSDAYQDRIAE